MLPPIAHAVPPSPMMSCHPPHCPTITHEAPLSPTWPCHHPRCPAITHAVPPLLIRHHHCPQCPSITHGVPTITHDALPSPTLCSPSLPSGLGRWLSVFLDNSVVEFSNDLIKCNQLSGLTEHPFSCPSHSLVTPTLLYKCPPCPQGLCGPPRGQPPSKGSGTPRRFYLSTQHSWDGSTDRSSDSKLKSTILKTKRYRR
jgi:hypothetical protein